MVRNFFTIFVVATYVGRRKMQTFPVKTKENVSSFFGLDVLFKTINASRQGNGKTMILQLSSRRK